MFINSNFLLKAFGIGIAKQGLIRITYVAIVITWKERSELLLNENETRVLAYSTEKGMELRLDGRKERSTIMVYLTLSKWGLLFFCRTFLFCAAEETMIASSWGMSFLVGTFTAQFNWMETEGLSFRMVGRPSQLSFLGKYRALENSDMLFSTQRWKWCRVLILRFHEEYHGMEGCCMNLAMLQIDGSLCCGWPSWVRDIY